MKCPHCSHSVGLGCISKHSLSFAGNRQNDEVLFCPSCNHQIYWSLRPAILFFGILLAMWGLSLLDRILMQATWLIPAYVFMSVVVIGVFAVYLRQKPNLLYHMRRSFAYRLYFLSSYFLLSAFAIQICFLYTNLIPARDDLEDINGTIISMHRNKRDVPEYVVLKKDGANSKFYFHFDDDFKKKWPTAKLIQSNTNVRILADESISITEDSYRIWELATASEIIISYASIKKIRTSNAKAENITIAKINLVLLLLFFFSLYFKRKVDCKKSSRC